MNSNRSKRIAQCSMATALAVVILMVGNILSFGEFFWYFVASIMIDLPEQNHDKLKCFVVVSMLSSLLCGYNFIYLASFFFLMGPYVIVNAYTQKLSPSLHYIVMSLTVFTGITLVAWFTPMFFLQLNHVESTSVLLTSFAVILAVSLIFDLIYGKLYNTVKRYILKVWFYSA